MLHSYAARFDVMKNLEKFLDFVTVLRGCLGPHRIQNAKCQLLWSGEIQNAKIFKVMFRPCSVGKFFCFGYCNTFVYI